MEQSAKTSASFHPVMNEDKEHGDNHQGCCRYHRPLRPVVAGDKAVCEALRYQGEERQGDKD